MVTTPVRESTKQWSFTWRRTWKSAADVEAHRRAVSLGPAEAERGFPLSFRWAEARAREKPEDREHCSSLLAASTPTARYLGAVHAHTQPRHVTCTVYRRCIASCALWRNLFCSLGSALRRRGALVQAVLRPTELLNYLEIVTEPPGTEREKEETPLAPGASWFVLYAREYLKLTFMDITTDTFYL